MSLASEADLDLVEVSPTAKPPVCKIMDYGKYKFEANKKLQASKKKQKNVQVKEIKFRPGTDIGDYNVKLRNLRSFLENGDKTKITVRFRGREMAYKQLGLDKFNNIIEKVISFGGVVEASPKMMGNRIIAMVSPSKKK